MRKTRRRISLHLHKGWAKHVRSAVLHAIALSHYAIMHARGRAANSLSADVRLRVEKERLQYKDAAQQEEIRIKDARMLQIPAHQRPRYLPTERMAILELKAAQGWSLAETARRFHVSTQTISSWMKRLNEEGPQALVQISQPVNKFPECVGYLVRRLRVLCPTMGKKKIAATLAREGLHLAATTVGRMLREIPSLPEPVKTTEKPSSNNAKLVVAKRPNHVWHVDLTIVPITSGFWTTWFPFALPQCWPFCWWVAVVVDQFSRRVMETATFHQQPTSRAVRTFLTRIMGQAGAKPKYLISDQGPQFKCDAYRSWCKHRRRKITPRYGAIGQHGSIAVVERAIKTVKKNCARLLLVPLRPEKFRTELDLFTAWYNESRPHTTLRDRTPNEVYYRRFPAVRKPRYEPRARWPRGSPCARSWALTRGRTGARLELNVEFLAGRRYLPIVTLRRVA